MRMRDAFKYMTTAAAVGEACVCVRCNVADVFRACGWETWQRVFIKADDRMYAKI